MGWSPYRIAAKALKLNRSKFQTAVLYLFYISIAQQHNRHLAHVPIQCSFVWLALTLQPSAALSHSALRCSLDQMHIGNLNGIMETNFNGIYGVTFGRNCVFVLYVHMYTSEVREYVYEQKWNKGG